jgi:hypothetical protein
MWNFIPLSASHGAFATRPFTSVHSLVNLLELLREKGKTWRGEIVLLHAQDVYTETMKCDCSQDRVSGRTYVPYGSLAELEELTRKIQLLGNDEKKFDKIWIYNVGYFIQ